MNIYCLLGYIEISTERLINVDFVSKIYKTPKKTYQFNTHNQKNLYELMIFLLIYCSLKKKVVYSYMQNPTVCKTLYSTISNFIKNTTITSFHQVHIQSDAFTLPSGPI